MGKRVLIVGGVTGGADRMSHIRIVRYPII